MQSCGRLQGRGLCPLSPQGLKANWLTTSHHNPTMLLVNGSRCTRAERIFRILRNKNNAYLPTLSKVFLWRQKKPTASHSCSRLFFILTRSFRWPFSQTDMRSTPWSVACQNLPPDIICLIVLAETWKKHEHSQKHLAIHVFLHCDPIFSHSLMKRGKNGLK